VPLYAVEIVRMLADRGLLERWGERYSPTGPVTEIEVPETLQALVAARLDALPLEERRLLQDAAVLGMSFSAGGLAAVSGMPERDVQRVLEGLVAKQLLALDTDPLSPERGHYFFLQGTVRRVAYARLARRECKERHLRAAAYFEQTLGPEAIEVADVLASHYLDAAATDPAAQDVEEITSRARRMEIAAGERAARLAAGEQAAAYFAQAAERTAAPLERAELLDRSGQAAVLAGQLEDAQARFEAAIELFEAGGNRRRAAVVSARIADIAEFEGRLQEARERLEAAYATLREGEADADLAEVAYKLAARVWEAGDPSAGERLELALEIAERLRLPDTLAAALNAKWLLLTGRGRNHEGLAVLKYALELALEHGLVERAMRTHNNLAMHLAQLGRREEALAQAKAGVALARQRGDRLFESALLANMPLQLFRLGRWGEALEVTARLPADRADAIARVEALLGSLLIRLARGERAQAEEDIVLIEAIAGTADRPEMLTIVSAARAAALEASGDHAAALRAAEPDIQARQEDQFVDSPRLELFVSALDAALGAGELDQASGLVALGRSLLDRTECPYLGAQLDRFEARIAARAGGGARAVAGFERAARSLRELSDPFALGIVLLETAEELPDSSAAGTSRREAREIFERLGALAWIDRADASRRPVGVA
jgi:tetratricopeptide (TPR) repeat protein